MTGVGVRRWAVAAVVITCGWSATASADIYQWRDQYGTLHFTNVPTNGRYKLVLHDSRAARPDGTATVLGTSIESQRFDPIITALAMRYQVEQALVKAVIKAESSFQPRAISPKGARGLMQLMPETARRHGVQDVYEPYDNIRGGVQHLRMLLDRYRGNVVLALAAYNAGERWVDETGGIPPFPETRQYVERVLLFRQHYLQQRLASLR